MTVEITTRPESLWQSSTIVLPFENEPKRVNFELRYLSKTDLWYMSLTDVQSGEIYFTYVPLLASSTDGPNNLWEPFWYSRIGALVCFPIVDNPKTQNPSRDNLGEFTLMWSDGNG